LTQYATVPFNWLRKPQSALRPHNLPHKVHDNLARFTKWSETSRMLLAIVLLLTVFLVATDFKDLPKGQRARRLS